MLEQTSVNVTTLYVVIVNCKAWHLKFALSFLVKLKRLLNRMRVDEIARVQA